MPFADRRLFPHVPTDLRMRVIERDDGLFDLRFSEYDGQAPRNPVADDLYAALSHDELIGLVCVVMDAQYLDQRG